MDATRSLVVKWAGVKNLYFGRGLSDGSTRLIWNAKQDFNADFLISEKDFLISEINHFLISGNDQFLIQKMCEFVISENDFLISENATLFWYQNFFSDIRNYFSDIKNHFLIPEKATIFWYQKTISDIRKSCNFLISENNFWYQKLFSDIRKSKFPLVFAKMNK